MLICVSGHTHGKPLARPDTTGNSLLYLAEFAHIFLINPLSQKEFFFLEVAPDHV
jgi:hypothetical protein